MRRSKHHARPGYVNLICCLLLIYALWGLRDMGFFVFIGPHTDPANDISLGVKVAVATVYIAVLACAVFMHSGANWARMLFYVVCAPVILAARIVVLVLYVQEPADVAFNIILSVVVVVFGCVALSLERANLFFTGRDTFFKEEGGRRGGEKRESRSRGNFEY